MNGRHQPELISFPLCPYVQRAVICLRLKQVDFKITYIDLSEPPEWFLKISPMGQVPVLKVGPDVIFESAVICELLDELYPPSIHPPDAVKKAKERAWVEYASALLREQYTLSRETDPTSLRRQIGEFFASLKPVEEQLPSAGPYFRGTDFGFADIAFAPIFTRMSPLPRLWEDSAFEALPKTRRWAEALLKRPDVTGSVLPTFTEDYLKMLNTLGSAILKR